ncbi:MAG: hypothetical protein LBC85_12485 [Fibromonadaceae bacterium]|jgi:thioredoxin-like negative regulator of GroEL|nr:hypothetical protein [Fibromonadaceae bacterium]
MKTFEELKKFYEEKQAALNNEKAEAFKKSKARGAKKAAADRLRLRKEDTRIKIMLGGYLLAEIKKTKNKELLSKITSTMQSERDKELLKSLGTSL